MLPVILNLPFIIHLFISLPLLNHKPPEGPLSWLTHFGIFYYCFSNALRILGKYLLNQANKFFLVF